MPSVTNDSLYRGTQMVLGEPDDGFGRGISTAFFALGLRDMAICKDGRQLRQAIVESVDVILCDVNLPGEDFLELAQTIRQGRLEANPFVIMIAMAHKSDGIDAARILLSGVDDLILKPAEPGLVVSRVAAFASRRGPFVITPAYVGPSRRGMKRNDGSDEETFEVPNTLRAKVAQRMAVADLGRLLENGRATLNESRTQSAMRVVARLTRQLALQTEPDESPYGTKHDYRTLAAKADEIVAENKNVESRRRVAAIAARIAVLARRGEAGIARKANVETELMLQLADAAMVAFVAERDASTSATPAIVATVDDYLKRV
jgi:DNA-binding response OmpR family regulator